MQGPTALAGSVHQGNLNLNVLMQERELLVELKVLEQRVLAEERGSHYSGASLAAEEDRQPLLQRRCGSGCRLCITPAELLLGCRVLGACVPGPLVWQAADVQLEVALFCL